MQNHTPLLCMEGITKTFPGVKALDDVDFQLETGEVHVLLGENGAGKSTLIKILAGAFSPDSGKMEINGEPVIFSSPKEAQDAGIAVIYQELNLVPYMTVAENIVLGHEPLSERSCLVDWAEVNKLACDALMEIGSDLDPGARIEDLGMAHRQIVEIAKAVSRRARIVVMDEPTSSLSDNEAEMLFTLIERLRDKGVGIIYICHRMEEVYRVGDRATVLRDGQKVSTVQVSETDSDVLVSMIVGRRLTEKYPYVQRTIGKPVMKVENLSTSTLLRDISFTLHEGEILGFTGVVGAGKTELARAIFGADPIEHGTITVKGKLTRIADCESAIRTGLGFIPEDRKGQGLSLIHSSRSNITLSSLQRFLRKNLIDLVAERAVAQSLVEKMNIKTPSLESPVGNLSGGNQQKVVLAKWLCSQSDILLFDEPTRGIDVGSKVEIYRVIMDLASKGTAILVMSSELPEILGICDRVMVMREGSIVAEFMRGEADQERLHAAAVGIGRSGGDRQ